MNEDLIHYLKSDFRLDWDGIHGIEHWLRVREIGAALAARNGADIRVVEAFAFVHDACRCSNSSDKGHGKRSARLAGELNESWLKLGIDQLARLQFACARHEKGMISGDVTIGTCWDADRLDLWRLGIEPDPGYLSTKAAQDEVFREWAARLYHADSLIHICGAAEIDLFRDHLITHLIRIVNPGNGDTRPLWFNGEYLQLEFGDVISETDAVACHTRAPGKADVEAALRFFRHATEAEGCLLVSCDYGASRSPALALVLLADLLGAGRESEALGSLLRQSPDAVPNGMVVRLGDELLGRDGALLSALKVLFEKITASIDSLPFGVSSKDEC